MIITKLYKGTVELKFEEGRHRFTVNGKSILSVTAGTSIIDKSRPLIYWAVGLTKDFLMENLSNLINDKKGDKIVALIEEASKQHSIRKQKAADIGTQVHDWVEKFIKAKTKEDYPEIPKDANVYNGVSAFLKWVDEDKVKFISSEKHIYSKKYNYAGIMDAEAVIGGKMCVVDFKTSKGIYPEFRFQVAAYQNAVEEETGKKYAGDKVLARFGKEDGEFEVHPYGDHDKDFKGFLNALNLRRRLKEITPAYKKS